MKYIKRKVAIECEMTVDSDNTSLAPDVGTVGSGDTESDDWRWTDGKFLYRLGKFGGYAAAFRQNVKGPHMCATSYLQIINKLKLYRI